MAMAIAKLPLLSVLLCILSVIFVVESAPKSSLITHLPGFNGTFPSKHYSGYITINKNSSDNLFYYFVTSEKNPSKDPVVLWLNGGPGCSSFDGFIYEHGPFNFEAGKSAKDMPRLHLNPHSWSKVSNIIYLDSPVGVGFSYSKDISSYTTGDRKTAADTHAFLMKWLQEFPEFQPNPFYISGESYSGIYVPTLASQIAQGIKSGIKPNINFKGYMIGNAVTDEVFDGNALVPFVHGMSLISDQMFEDAKNDCKGVYYASSSSLCNSALSKIYKCIEDLNIYNILEPCYHGSSESTKSLPISFKELGLGLGLAEKYLPVRKRMFGRAWPFFAPVRSGKVPLWPELVKAIATNSSKIASVPCINDEVATTWLNNPDVRKAIHAATENVSGEWLLCTDNISYEHDAGSMIPFHKNLTTAGYRALIFSGDHDMCVPYTGSEAWTRSLGFKIVDEWRPWMVNGQVAGYTQGYDHNLTFLTIKGSGHTVPEYKPREALSFYSRWLEGQNI